MKYRRNVGMHGENFATRILIEDGFEILERNYRGRHGEIDIIAKKGSTIHFIEVKTRNGDECGAPAESVNDMKINRIRSTAADYLSMRKGRWLDVSFDVFEIQTNIIWNCA